EAQQDQLQGRALCLALGAFRAGRAKRQVRHTGSLHVRRASGCWYAVANQAAGVSGANRRSQQGQRHLVEASESLSGRSALTSWLLQLRAGTSLLAPFSPGWLGCRRVAGRILP